MGGAPEQMAVGAITERNVRDTLRAIRYSKPPSEIPLLNLDVVSLRLRKEGVSDTAECRAWVIGRLLSEVVGDRLESKRSGDTRGSALRRPPDIVDIGALDRVEDDFRAGSIEREAWSMVCTRYFTVDPPTYPELASRLSQTPKTLERRLARGHQALADELRAAELDAGPRLAEHPGAHPAARVLVAEQEPPMGAVSRDVELAHSPTDRSAEPLNEGLVDRSDILRRLLEAIQSDSKIVRLSGDEVRAVSRHPVADLVEYRLGRIAQWSLPRYRLDERFVGLTLLIDQGEESMQGRWQAQDMRYGDLRDVMDAAPDPALVLLGPPGSGKSTLLRRLDFDLAVDGLRETGGSLSFFVQLNHYQAVAGESLPSPRAWLAAQWKARCPHLPALERLLAEGRMVLLLDALNEMPHDGFADYRERIGSWKRFVQEISAEAKGNRVVFSCRSLDYSTPLSTPALRVPQVRIEPMSDDQVQEFLRVYYPAKAESLWERLEGSQQRELVRIAYFARLFVEQAAETGAVPEGRAALFTGFVRRALQREVQRDNPHFSPNGLVTERDYKRIVSARRWKSPYDLPERGLLLPKLSELAHEMQRVRIQGEASQVRVDLDQAQSILDHGRDEDILAAGIDLGVLDEDRDQEEVFFYHQLLQEYFAARRLAAAPDPELVRAPWRADEIEPSVDAVIDGLDPADPLPPLPQTGWEETTLLAAAISRDPEGFVRGVMSTNLALAGRAAAQPDVLKRVGDGVLNELRDALAARSRDPKADLRDRIACARAAGRLGDGRFERRNDPAGAHIAPQLVEIPTSEYAIGDDEPIVWQVTGETGTNAAHLPYHVLRVQGFWIGRYPVTNAEWACFLEAYGYEDERWWPTHDARRWRRGELPSPSARWNADYFRNRFLNTPGLFEQLQEEGRFPNEAAVERWRRWIALDDEAFEAAWSDHWKPQRFTRPSFWGDTRFNHPLQPVVGISWYEALAYCTWLAERSGMAIRLPTEVEWEAAARGAAGRRHPWGETWNRLWANTDETRIERTSPVGVFPHGDTPEHVADLGGNIDEWTMSLFGDIQGDDLEVAEYAYPYAADDGREDLEAEARVRRASRGGGWYADASGARSYCRGAYHPDDRRFDLGMRVVVSGSDA